MGYDRTAAKRPINVTLNEDIVRRARSFTRNLSGTLEVLLQEFIAREEVQRRDEDAAVDRVIDSLDAFHRAHGLLSDEFGTL